MTTGEIAKGTSISALIIALPRKSWRTRTIAVITPKIVLSGTAMPTQRIVSQKAWRPSELVIASIGWLRPCSKVR